MSGPSSTALNGQVDTVNVLGLLHRLGQFKDISEVIGNLLQRLSLQTHKNRTQSQKLISYISNLETENIAVLRIPGMEKEICLWHACVLLFEEYA